MLSGKDFFQKRLHEYFLRKTGADVVGIGEDEITLVELMDAFEKSVLWNRTVRYSVKIM